MNTKEKLIYKIEDVLEKFYHDEQYEMEDAVEAILSLLTSEVEKIADMIKSTNNLRMAKVDGKDDWNDALEQSACKMDALEKEVRKALSEIGGKI